MNIKKLIICLALLIPAFFPARGQTLKAFLQAGENAFAQNDFYAALKFFEEALDIEENLDVRYKYAASARQFNAFTLAEQNFQMVWDSDQGEKYPLTAFWLAVVKQHLGKFEEAAKWYDDFVANTHGDVEPYFKKLAKKNSEDCRWAQQIVQDPDSIDIMQLGTEVNTPYSEFGPAIEGDTLYYSSFRFFKEKDTHKPNRPLIKVETFEESTGLANVTDWNETDKHTAHTAFNEAKTRMYYTICDYTGAADIRCEIFSRRKLPDGSWSKPLALPNSINTNGFTTTEPSIGYDETLEKEVLYFVSDRPGGKGKLDIWYCTLDEEGHTGEPQNLSALNTEENDITPFWHTASQSLFFSSDGYKGLGGYDIFHADKIEGEWLAPQHLGYPLNSSLNDIYYVLDEDGETAYFASNRIGATYLEKEKEACCNDLYQVKYDISLDFLALTFDDDTRHPLAGVTLDLIEVVAGREKLLESRLNPLDHKFPLKVQKGKTYILRAHHPDYLPLTDSISLRDAHRGILPPMIKELYLRPITVNLDVLTYDFDTKRPVEGVHIQLQVQRDGDWVNVDDQINPLSNDTHFPLDRNLYYRVIANKPGYQPDTLDLNTLGIKEPTRLKKEFFLIRVNFDDYMPLALYFDNDMPDKASRQSYTRTSYEESYLTYMEELPLYFSERARNLSPADSIAEVLALNTFFDEELKRGYERLSLLSEQLLLFLQTGGTVELVLKGYASPRAEADYNKVLGQRRVNCLRNHFYTYKSGAFQRYLNSGQLQIEEISFGEEKASKSVIDDILDTRNSIYSVPAALERRVEIVRNTADRNGGPLD